MSGLCRLAGMVGSGQLTASRGVQENRSMRRCSAGLGLLAMLVALLTAPLFHEHERDSHGHSVSFVHAHLNEFETPDSHKDSGIENRDSHAHARWVDVFTFETFSLGVDWPVDLAVALAVPLLEQQGNFAVGALPPVHGPPDTPSSSPRSPPSI